MDLAGGAEMVFNFITALAGWGSINEGGSVGHYDGWWTEIFLTARSCRAGKSGMPLPGRGWDLTPWLLHGFLGMEQLPEMIMVRLGRSRK